MRKTKTPSGYERASDLSKAKTFRDMSEISGCRSSNLLLLLGTISLQFIPGFCDGDSSSSKSRSGSTLALIPFGLVVVGLLFFFLFKLWQKKKREEQYARLLKLFEEDDELELELGLRD